MTTPALAFDAAAHRYTVGDRELLSVTTALKDAGLIDDRWFNDEAAVRGTAVHAAVERFHVDGAVPDDEVTPPFFDAYLEFQQSAGFDLQASEERICDLVLGYAGTLDLRGRFRRFAHGIDVVDIKTGAVPSWVGYQTAGYARCLSERPVRRWALQLRATGTFSLHPLTSRTDERVFLAALTVAQAKRGWL